MADTTYTVALKDEVSLGLSKISKNKKKLDKQFKDIKLPKAAKLPNALKSTAKAVDKVSGSAKEAGGAVGKLDRVLKMFSKPIGKVAGSFGVAGDTVEGFTGSMIGMGGVAGAIGLSLFAVAAAAAGVAASYYGMTKAALFADEQTAKFNKTVMLVRGSLGQYIGLSDAVIKKSLELSRQLSTPYEELAVTMSKAVALGSDLKTSEDFATVITGMKLYGKAGEDVNAVLDRLASGDKFKRNQKDVDQLQMALDRLGVTKIKALEVIKEKDAKKQLALVLSNKNGIKDLKNQIESSIPAIDKLKNAWAILLAKVFGGQGKNPLNNAIDKIIKIIDDPKNIKKIQNFFDKMSESIGKVDLSGLLNSIISILDKVDLAIKGLEKIYYIGKYTLPGQIIRHVIRQEQPTEKENQINKVKELYKIPIVEGITIDPKGIITAPPIPSANVEGPTSLNMPDYKVITEKVAKNTTNNTKVENKIDIKVNAAEGMDEKELAKQVAIQISKRLSDAYYTAGGMSPA